MTVNVKLWPQVYVQSFGHIDILSKTRKVLHLSAFDGDKKITQFKNTRMDEYLHKVLDNKVIHS